MMRRPHYDNSESQFNVSPMEILRTLHEMGADPEDRGDVIQARYCPACTKPHNNERTNMFTFGISKS